MASDDASADWIGRSVQFPAKKWGRKWAEPLYGWPCDGVMVPGIVQAFIKHPGRGKDRVEVQWNVEDSENEETITVDKAASLLVADEPTEGICTPTQSLGADPDFSVTFDCVIFTRFGKPAFGSSRS